MIEKKRDPKPKIFFTAAILLVLCILGYQLLFPTPVPSSDGVIQLLQKAEAVYQPVPVRIARLLLDRCGYGLLTNLTDPDVIRVTHQDIACFIGATRPNVSKCLADFARQGIIAQEKRSIRTLDRSALAEIAKIGAEP